MRFVAGGTLSDPPRIVGDCNGWQGGDMQPSPDGRTFTLDVVLHPAARIEYLIAYEHRFVTDPGNSLTIDAPGGGRRSELRMPGYRPMPPLASTHAHGVLEEIPFTSKAGERRRIRAYVPPGKRQRLPILYVHDGDIFVTSLRFPAVLDSLIGAGRIAPAIVVFIDAVDRHDDYAAGSRFRTVLSSEIVPLLEGRYSVDVKRRALMGLSRSTLGALDTCSHSPVSFESCVLVAPAIPASQFSAVLPEAGRRLRLFIATGTYDIPLIDAARAMRQELERRLLDVYYVEAPEGHNHTAFLAALPGILARVFPSA